jgi:hypothetical protein
MLGALLRGVLETLVSGVLTELLGLVVVLLLAIGLDWLLAGVLADAVAKPFSGVVRPSVTEVSFGPSSCGNGVDEPFSACWLVSVLEAL